MKQNSNKTCLFKISNVFALESRKYIVIAGDIVEDGLVAKDMFFVLNDKVIKIKELEFVDRFIKNGIENSLGLIIKYKSNEEKQELLELLSDVKELELKD